MTTRFFTRYPTLISELTLVAIVMHVPLAQGTACTNAGEHNYIASTGSMRWCNGTSWTNVAVSGSGAACSVVGEIKYSSPNLLLCNGTNYMTLQSTATATTCANAGEIKYNSPTLQYCDGAHWENFNTAKAYFIYSANTYTGSFGGLAGANATCLSELQSNTFVGKSTAIVTAASVFAFLCDNSSCQNLQPSTVYTFARSSDGTSGGATLTTDSSGLGPNDSANWTDSTHFGTTGAIWVGRLGNTSSATSWGSTIAPNTCNSWTDASTSYQGSYGAPANTDYNRWWYAHGTCNIVRNYICFVNP